jgi:hypothetical protein
MSFDASTGRKLPRGRSVSSALAIRDDMLERMPALVPNRPAKIIAREIGATPRAIEGHKQGEHLPSSPVLIALGQRAAPMREYLIRLLHAELGESGENPSQVLTEAIRTLQNEQRRLEAALQRLSAVDDGK